MRTIVAIDLGTTNSMPASFNEISGQGDGWASRSGSRITPSVVNIDENNRYVVGGIAKQNAILYPESTFENFKRMMGKEKHAFTVNDASYSPQFLSALVLKSIKKDIENYLGTNEFDVVITVPAYFDSDACQATKEAGTLAGLQVVDLLHEPIAAVYHYASGLNLENKTILVVDLGGGTLDVAVVAISKKEITELVIDGCLELGGIDWNKALYSYIKEKYLKGKHMGPDDEQELLMSIETAKKMLSERNDTRIVARTEEGREMIRITREEFEACSADLLAKVKATLVNVQKEMEEKKISKIDKIFLVGGATRMPQIENLLKSEDMFPNVEMIGRDQDEAVARGAAVYGQIFAEKKKMFRPKKLKRISASSYGLKAIVDVEKKKSKISNIIYRNAELPISVSKNFQTIEDGQKRVSLEVYENMSDNSFIEIQEGVLLGRNSLEIKEELPAKSTLVVTFTLNEDGTLVADGMEPKGKTKVEIVVEPKVLLGKEELLIQKERLECMESQ